MLRFSPGSSRRRRDRAVIGGLLAGPEPRMVFQPIGDLRSRWTLGLKGLLRFGQFPEWPPDRWFAAAEAVGLGVELELRAIRNAIAKMDRIPDEVYVSLPRSQALTRRGRLEAAFGEAALGRVVLEVTEHAVVDDVEHLQKALAPLRAGFSSLQHLMRQRPEVIKLDLSLARVVDWDRTTRALVAALVAFANETGSTVVAEGVEDLRTVRAYADLRVHAAQ